MKELYQEVLEYLNQQKKSRDYHIAELGSLIYQGLSDKDNKVMDMKNSLKIIDETIRVAGYILGRINFHMK